MTRFPWNRPAAIRRWWRHVRLADVVILTMVPALILGYLVLSAAADHRVSGQLDDWWSRSRSIHASFGARMRLLLNTPAAVATERHLTPEAVPNAISLEIPPDRWRAMVGDPLRGFDEWYDADLVQGRDRLPVRLRKRGDTSIHWTTPKISFTLRTDRRRLVGGRRQWGFSVRDVLPGYIANRLLLESGLLAPATDVVPVFLNGRFYGLFRQLELIDESFLRQRGRMPGNIFRGDVAERGELFKGMPRSVFESSAIWDRVARNDRPTAPARRLDSLLTAINGTTMEDQLELLDLIDVEEMARLLAVLLVAGDPYHMDNLHNQFWYEDPSSGRLHPVPWDVRLQPLGSNTQPLNTLVRALIRHPDIVRGTLEHLAEWVDDSRAAQLGRAWADSVESRFAKFFHYEYLREGVIPPVGRAGEVYRTLQGNVDSLRTWVADTRLAVAAGQKDGIWVLDLESRGYAGVVLDSITLPGGRAVSGLAVLMDTNGNGRLDPGDARLPVDARMRQDTLVLIPIEPLSLSSGWTTRELRYIVPDRVHYRLFLVGASGMGGRRTIPRPHMRNALTGQVVAPEEWGLDRTIAGGSSWHQWRFPRDTGRHLRWSGLVQLDGTLILSRFDTLEISPGTTVLLAPDVSLVTHGLVRAIGTEAAPIRFMAADVKLPWGAVALQGPGTNGSEWRWVEFHGGGGAEVHGVEYVGMVNVHRAEDILFEHAHFADNLRSDDTFRALHSEITLRSSVFERANSDAVDFDFSRGVIMGNRFSDSGGDAIDLMTSNPRVVGNTILHSGDKGISIGEASHPIIVGNRLRDNVVGVEIKDGSEPVLYRNQLDHNGVALRVSRKNWRYGIGGWPKLVSNVLADNGADIVLDTESRVTQTAIPDALAGQWVEAAFAIGAGGPADSPWRLGDLGAPLVWQEYGESFPLPAIAWYGVRGVRRVEIAGPAVVISLRPGGGEARLPVAFEVDTEALLVVELAGRDLVDAAVAIDGSSGTISRPIPVDSAGFQLVMVSLPAGSYQSIRLLGRPRQGLSREDPATGLVVQRYARLSVRRLAVYPLPDTSP